MKLYQWFQANGKFVFPSTIRTNRQITCATTKTPEEVLNIFDRRKTAHINPENAIINRQKVSIIFRIFTTFTLG